MFLIKLSKQPVFQEKEEKSEHIIDHLHLHMAAVHPNKEP